MNTAEQFIKERLQGRADSGSLRKLPPGHFPVDFCSNDYLGFARSAALKELTEAEIKYNNLYRNGSGGSRLISGNTTYTEETESYIADFHQAEASLIFNSGYDANLGLLSSLAERGDTIIADEFIHASLVDGARLTHASRYTFKHNNLEDLEAKLTRSAGKRYVVVESVYSMDGDIAPLTEISRLCEQYNANLIVDEAHALGIFGHHGKGLIEELGLQDKVFSRVVTFGKALGCHGAAVLGSRNLRSYLVNFARSFIYTTAAPVHSIAAIRSAYHLLKERDFTSVIKDRIRYYTDTLGSYGLNTSQATQSTIQTFICPGNSAVRAAAQLLQNQGLDLRPIMSPTVPAGQERLRICLHTYNTNDEIKMLINGLSQLKKNE